MTADFPAPDALADWTQLQGSPLHAGATALVIAPPLHVEWARSVGGHLMGGPPVVAEGRVFVPVVDLADETAGGVVALDARTGAPAWEVRTGAAVRNSPAVADGVCVFGASDGVVHAVGAQTGSPLWTVDLGAGVREMSSFLYAAPTIADGVVYVGIQRRYVALDLMTGETIWSSDPGSPVWAVTYSAAAIGGGVGVSLVGRGKEGVFGFDAASGAELWRILAPISTAVNASPIIQGDTVFLANVESHVCAVDLVTGTVAWSHLLYDLGYVDWALGIMATPALADGRLFVPTPREYLYAVDAGSGRELWKLGSATGVIHPLPYGTLAGGYTASPVVTGDVVWAGGVDGVLRAARASSGELLWSRDLGAPILTGPVPAGGWLFVGTWDGTVRALAPGDPAEQIFPPVDPGCECALGRRRGGVGGGAGGALLALLAAAALGAVGRGRRQRGDAASCARMRARTSLPTVVAARRASSVSRDTRP